MHMQLKKSSGQNAILVIFFVFTTIKQNERERTRQEA